MSNKEELHKALDNLQNADAPQANPWLVTLSKAVLAQGKILEQMLSDGPMQDQNRLLLKPTEVATLFGVDPKTVTRWARKGKLEAHLTLGGHRRYMITDIRSLLRSQSSKAAAEVTEENAQVN